MRWWEWLFVGYVAVGAACWLRWAWSEVDLSHANQTSAKEMLGNLIAALVLLVGWLPMALADFWVDL